MKGYINRYIPFMFPESNEVLTGIDSSLIRFKEQILKHDIYLDLKELLNKTISYKAHLFTRDDVKTQLLTLFYSYPKHYITKEYPLRTLFEEQYNMVIELFDDIKAFKERTYKHIDMYGNTINEIDSLFRKSFKVDKGYRRLATLLQRIESKIVLDITCKELSKVFPQMAFITIHDSIIVTPENEKIVKDYLIKFLKNNIGFKPQLKSLE